MADDFDEGLWEYEKQRAGSARSLGVVAIVLGLLGLAGAAGLAILFVEMDADLRVVGVFGVGSLGAIGTGVGMYESGRGRMKRLKREREEARFAALHQD